MSYALEKETFIFLKSGSDGGSSGWGVLKAEGRL